MIIEIINLTNRFGAKVIHSHLDFSVEENEICAIIGFSGSGKTLLIRSILQLEQSSYGRMKIFGKDIERYNNQEVFLLRQKWGVLFQKGALFSSLNVLENISFPLKEFSNLNAKARKEIVMIKLFQVGLEADVAFKFPAELSGGMIKRVSLARAIVLEPKLLFLDEPTAGLDPSNADSLDKLILNLKKTLGMTIVIITHDLDTLWNVSDRV